jgi:hypothetical protein
MNESKLADDARRDVRRKATALADVADALRDMVSQTADSRNTADFLYRVAEQMRRMAHEWKGGL